MQKRMAEGKGPLMNAGAKSVMLLAILREQLLAALVSGSGVFSFLMGYPFNKLEFIV